MSDKKTNPDDPSLNSGLPTHAADSIAQPASKSASWSWYKKLGFRIIFVFLLAMCIPFTSSWYKNVFTLDWLHPHYRDIYDIARFQPSFGQFFGGRGDNDDAAGGNDNAAGGGRNGRNRGGNNKNNSSDSSNINSSSSGRHHHNGADSTLVGNGEGGFGRHHHHHDADSTGAAGNDGKFAGEQQGQFSHHHHHGNDSSHIDNRLAGNDSGFSRHHHRDTVNGANAAGNDSTKLASLTPGNHKGNGNTGGGNSVLPPKRSFLADYTDWGIAFLIGIVGGLIWTLVDRKSKSYNLLYYWIRVVVRYRAGIGIIGFGFTKLFPTQMPFPSLGLLNSNFGDFTAQKIYWMSVGVVPWYQVFGGIIEIVAGTMLFFRKTTTFGAILLAGALGDITYVNYAYDGGVHVYAFYFVFLALFLIADDIPKLYNLLILERYTVPVRYYPDFKKAWLKYSRVGLKALVFLIFFVILTYTEVINFKYDPYKQPSTAGVKQLRGNYHVTEFKINGQEIPYSPLDSVRWQQATFENWTTLTFKVNHPVIIDPSNGGGSPMKDIQRTFEITGVAGGERAFHYYADTIDKVLYLEDKNVMALRGSKRGGGRGNHTGNDKKQPNNWISNVAWQHIGSEKEMIDPHAWSTRRDREFAAKTPEPKRSRMVLKYSTLDGSRVILSGINESRDSIYVVLDRYDRKYTLPASTLSAGKY
ncbi:MFS transporter [Mucilaginibacter sp.]